MSEESIVQTFSGKVPLVILACLVALVTLGAGALYFGPGVMENLHVEHRLFPNAVSVELANVPSAPTRSERIDLGCSGTAKRSTKRQSGSRSIRARSPVSSPMRRT
jgi:hypothetical protein